MSIPPLPDPQAPPPVVGMTKAEELAEVYLQAKAAIAQLEEYIALMKPELLEQMQIWSAGNDGARTVNCKSGVVSLRFVAPTIPKDLPGLKDAEAGMKAIEKELLGGSAEYQALKRQKKKIRQEYKDAMVGMQKPEVAGKLAKPQQASS